MKLTVLGNVPVNRLFLVFMCWSKIEPVKALHMPQPSCSMSY